MSRTETKDCICCVGCLCITGGSMFPKAGLTLPLVLRPSKIQISNYPGWAYAWSLHDANGDDWGVGTLDGWNWACNYSQQVDGFDAPYTSNNHDPPIGRYVLAGSGGQHVDIAWCTK